jgi:hypothetical protein
MPFILKASMKIIWKLFITAFLYCLFVSSLFVMVLDLFLFKTYPEFFTTIGISISLLSAMLIFVEFGIFYLIGKKHNLTKSLVSSMVSIYLGAAVGLIIATSLMILINPFLGGSEIIDGTYLIYTSVSLLTGAVSHLFTDLAGLAVGYFISKERKTAPPSNASAESIPPSIYVMKGVPLRRLKTDLWPVGGPVSSAVSGSGVKFATQKMIRKMY